MTTYKSTPHTARKKMVIKLGGSTLEGLHEDFFTTIKALQKQGVDCIITHGGGPAINRALAQQQIASHVLNGIRVTSEAAIDVVRNALIGTVNPSLVNALQRAGIAAIGLNGFDNNLLEAAFLDKETYGYVGKITAVNTAIIDTLLAANIIPVIACIAASYEGDTLNVNGDTVASEVALATAADSLLLVTDVQGIRIEGNNQLQATPQQIAEWITDEHIYGGMIPKVEGALACLAQGIPSVQIVNETLQGTTITN